jgi:predicted DNA-binding transcriptional regulator AlpA
MSLSDMRVAPQSKRRKSRSKRKSAAQAKAAKQNWRTAGLPPPAGHNAPPDPTPRIEHRDRVLTLQQWADVNGFSLATARRILESGSGPPVLQLSPRRVGIKESANAEWQASRAR